MALVKICPLESLGSQNMSFSVLTSLRLIILPYGIYQGNIYTFILLRVGHHLSQTSKSQPSSKFALLPEVIATMLKSLSLEIHLRQ